MAYKKPSEIAGKMTSELERFKANLMMVKPVYIFLLAIVLITSVFFTFNHYKYLFMPKPDYAKLGYVQVEAGITNVLPSGRGIKMSTLLLVRYEYDGREYSSTLRLNGYSEGRFKKGVTIKRWLNPAKPETLIDE